MSLKADVEVVNASNLNLSVPGNLITIKKIQFYTKTGKLIGTANTNLSNIAIPRNGTQLIQNIPVQVPISQALGSITDILDIMENTANLQISTTVEVFGKEFII